MLNVPLNQYQTLFFQVQLESMDSCPMSVCWSTTCTIIINVAKTLVLNAPIPFQIIAGFLVGSDSYYYLLLSKYCKILDMGRYRECLTNIQMFEKNLGYIKDT